MIPATTATPATAAPATAAPATAAPTTAAAANPTGTTASATTAATTTAASEQSSVRRTTNRAANWSQAEDTQLCTSWLRISDDLASGRDQRGPLMWKRVMEDFDQNFPEANGRPHRPVTGLSSRWNQIQKKVSKYCGFLEQVRRTPENGNDVVDNVSV